jgi:transcriptional regulator with XRE-family HTH domain
MITPWLLLSQETAPIEPVFPAGLWAQGDSMTGNNSTLLMSRVTFGRALRRLRSEVNHFTLTEVAESLACDNSLISRIENGKRVCSQEHFAKLMDLYEVPASQRDELVELHAAARDRRQPWWFPFSDVISAQYERFIGFEAAASTVSEYQVGILPGLLQTEAYAQAVTGVGFTSLGPDQIEALVEVRGLRQRHRLLETESPMECHYVITQAALEFQVGGKQTHRQQLKYLLEISTHRHVDLRVIPYEKGEEAAQIAAFKILEFSDEDVPDVAFGESVAGSLTIDSPRDLRRLHRLFRSLEDAAYSPDDSRDVIARTLNKED